MLDVENYDVIYKLGGIAASAVTAYFAAQIINYNLTKNFMPKDSGVAIGEAKKLLEERNTNIDKILRLSERMFYKQFLKKNNIDF
ncbi:MAG: hypothetical protein WA139_03050 [Candidatus Aenigmatarchaeota archaeon]